MVISGPWCCLFYFNLVQGSAQNNAMFRYMGREATALTCIHCRLVKSQVLVLCLAPTLGHELHVCSLFPACAEPDAT